MYISDPDLNCSQTFLCPLEKRNQNYGSHENEVVRNKRIV